MRADVSGHSSGVNPRGSPKVGARPGDISVLWIDDEPNLLKTTAKALTQAGCRIEFAASGTAGLDAVFHGPYDVILLDWKLPDMTGAHVLERLRRTGCRTPVVILTGYGSEDVAFQSGRFGADVYLTKPIGATTLLAVLREVTGRSGRRPAAPHPAPGAATGFTRHNSGRLADAIVRAMALERDPRTFADWATLPGVTEDSLHELCGLLRLDARATLTFTRLLRAVALVEQHGEAFADVLDVAAEKTLTGLLDKAGFAAGDTAPAVTISRFLAQQQLLTDTTVLRRISELLGLTP